MKSFLQTLRQWHRGNATARLLNRWNDRLLADIGVARGDVSRSVHIFH